MSWIAKAGGLSEAFVFFTLLLGIVFWRFISVGDYEKALLTFTLWFSMFFAFSVLENLNEETWKKRVSSG